MSPLVQGPAEVRSRLPVSRLSITMEATEDCLLPSFTGSLLRGMFGHSLRRVFCMTGRRECTECPAINSCLYNSIFQEERNVPVFPGGRFPPRPYIINAPQGGTFRKGDSLEWGFTVCGPFASHIPSFILAFQIMAQKGLGARRNPFKLTRVRDSLNGTLIYSANADHDDQKEENAFEREKLNWQIKELKEILKAPENIPERAEILFRFASPARFTAGGKHLYRLNGPDFLTAVRRRYELMHLHYGELDREDIKTDESFRLIALEENTVRRGRYSNRQGRALEMRGLLGLYRLEGADRALQNLLRAMTVLHAGKSAGFGMGRLEILEMRPV